MRGRGPGERDDHRTTLTTDDAPRRSAEVKVPLRRGTGDDVRRVSGERIVVIVCDVWDTHWCAAVRDRVTDLAHRVDGALSRFRSLGASIVHAPSDTLAFYDTTPQRRRAAEVRRVIPPPPADDPAPAMPPVTGCECTPPCPRADGPPWPWSRQHAIIGIDEADWISDEGDEIYSIVRDRRAELVLMCGVHTNVCVLDRPFGIRALRGWDVPVALVRDLSEAFPSHLTDDTVAYIEAWYCPSVASDELIAG